MKTAQSTADSQPIIDHVLANSVLFDCRIAIDLQNSQSVRCLIRNQKAPAQVGCLGLNERVRLPPQVARAYSFERMHQENVGEFMCKITVLPPGAVGIIVDNHTLAMADRKQNGREPP